MSTYDVKALIIERLVSNGLGTLVPELNKELGDQTSNPRIIERMITFFLCKLCSANPATNTVPARTALYNNHTNPSEWLKGFDAHVVPILKKL